MEEKLREKNSLEGEGAEKSGVGGERRDIGIIVGLQRGTWGKGHFRLQRRKVKRKKIGD